ncbi:HAD hydrolase family protein [Gemella sp. zg-1178]|uniref:HAD hydrolase family protein n=1 Tax=Gemella sp. zg-1178 TaxID=2840372 RepID=UPI0035300C78
MEVDGINIALENKICQLNVFVDKGEEEQEFLKYMSSSKSVGWTSWFTDIIAKDGGKDVGIKKLAAYYGIDIKETMTFGGGNDIDMLKNVTLGVAMVNARDYVKKVADYVTDTVDN